MRLGRGEPHGQRRRAEAMPEGTRVDDAGDCACGLPHLGTRGQCLRRFRADGARQSAPGDKIRGDRDAKAAPRGKRAVVRWMAG